MSMSQEFKANRVLIGLLSIYVTVSAKPAMLACSHKNFNWFFGPAYSYTQ